MLKKISQGFIAASVVIATALAAAGCRPHGNDVSCYADVPIDGWAYDAPLTFEPQLRDSVAVGDLTLSLRHTNNYLYSNIYVEVAVADSLSTVRDTVNVILADEFGKWQGSGIATDFQITDTVSTGITLHRPVKITVRHLMRVDNLEDIEQVGVAFIESKL